MTTARATATVRSSRIEMVRVRRLGVARVLLMGMEDSLEESVGHGEGEPAREGVRREVFFCFYFVWNECDRRYLGVGGNVL